MQIAEIYSNNHRLKQISLAQRNLFMLISAAMVFLSSWAILNAFTLVIFVSLLCICTPMSALKVMKLLFWPFIFVATSCLTLLVSINSGIIIFKWMNIEFGYEPQYIQRILFIASKAMALCTVFYFYISTTSISEIAQTMHKIRIPALFIELFILIYKYIFSTISTSQQIIIAQKSRLAYAHKRNNYNNIALWGTGLLNQSLMQAEANYNGMLARGYQDQLITLKQNTQKKLSTSLMIILAVQLTLFIGFYLVCQS